MHPLWYAVQRYTLRCIGYPIKKLVLLFNVSETFSLFTPPIYLSCLYAYCYMMKLLLWRVQFNHISTLHLVFATDISFCAFYQKHGSSISNANTKTKPVQRSMLPWLLVLFSLEVTFFEGSLLKKETRYNRENAYMHSLQQAISLYKKIMYTELNNMV